MKYLSSNNIQLRIIPIVLVALMLLFVLTLVLKNSLLFLLISYFIITSISTWYILKTYHKIFNVFYDTEFLHLKNSKLHRKIKLENVRYIERKKSNMRILGTQYYEYHIAFSSAFGMIEYIHIWIHSVNNNISDFQKCLHADNFRH